MTILQALSSHYDRLVVRGDAPAFGFSRERISYAVVLSPEGRAVDVTPLLDTSGTKPRPTLRQVPQPVKRTSGIAANFLWDKTSYALGVKRDPATKQVVLGGREHDAFKKLHEELLAGTDDEGLQTFLAFLRGWRPQDFESLPNSEDISDTNVVFRLDGECRGLHERPSALSAWTDHLSRRNGKEGLCLVTGEQAPVARLHPVVKGVKGAQSSGASIVSFNLDAFESYGKKQGTNAPVSERAAFGYATALNALLENGSGRRIQIGDATTVFWAEAVVGEAGAAAAEELFAILVDPPPTDQEETVRISDKLGAIAAGRPLEEVVPEVHRDTRFHILGLSPNAARLSVRFWYVGSIGEIARRIAEHWCDLRLDPSPWTNPPSARRLLYETAVQRKADNISPTLGGALMRAILTGGRYPRAFLAAVVTRMRADKNVNGMRAAICKACLARDHRLGFEEEDVPVSLNPDEPNVAYRLGRLFAVYEGVQRAALGGSVNATIKDRYFGAASATPASIFPLLERNSAHHLATLRKGDKGGLAHWFEREIDSIFAGVDSEFPRSLRLGDQGRFALGYHHQRATRRNVSETEGAVTDEGVHKGIES